jgi:hypothetical protein
VRRSAREAEPHPAILSLRAERAEGAIGVSLVLGQVASPASWASVTLVGIFRPGLTSHWYSLRASHQTSSTAMPSRADVGSAASKPISSSSGAQADEPATWCGS